MIQLQERTSIHERRPSRKERLRLKKPERFHDIIRVATPILATEGYRSTNMNRLADSVGVGVGTLYSYFDDKDDLFLSCVEAAADTDFEVKRKRFDTKASALEMLHTIIQVEIELMQLDPNGQQLLKSVFYGVNSHLEVGKASQELYLGSIDLVNQALGKGIKEGVFNIEGETHMVAFMFNGIMETFHVLSQFLDEQCEVDLQKHPAVRAFEILCWGIYSDRARKEIDTHK
jgi:AcrR family transcriptional regulator